MSLAFLHLLLLRVQFLSKVSQHLSSKAENHCASLSIQPLTAGYCRGIGGLTDAAAAPLSCSAMGFQIGFHAVGMGLDIVHLIEICNQTGEPSHIQKLRDLADEMEKQLDEIIQKPTEQQQQLKRKIS